MRSAGAVLGWSLAARLGLRLAAVMLLAVLLAGAAVTWQTFATIRKLDDSALQDQAQLIARALPPTEAAEIALPDWLVAPFRQSDADNMFLVFAGTRLAASSGAADARLLARFVPARARRGFFAVPAGVAGRPGMIGFLLPHGKWRVAVLQGREQSSVLRDSLLRKVLLGSAWLLGPIGVVTVIVGVLTLHHGLRPLRQVFAAAALVRPGQPGLRLPGSGLPRELAPLVAQLNEALARLEQGLDAQHRFMAEAAHALRTPLAVLTARLDVPHAHQDAAGLRHDVDRMARLVGQLLRMARLDGLPLDVTHRLDLREVAVEAVTHLAPLGLKRGVELALSGASAGPMRGNHAALAIALTNLIENALAAAPAGSTVEVAVSAPATIRVLDRGPGVAPEHRARIFQPFERGPEAVAGGSGLGLAIVARIAAAHGGTASLAPRPGGGSVFTLALPG